MADVDARGADGRCRGRHRLRPEGAESHASNWNDDEACLRQGRTRDQVCSGELDAGKRAETWMLIGGVSTGAFAAATLVSYWLQRDQAVEATVGFDCGVGCNQVLCAGRFWGRCRIERCRIEPFSIEHGLVPGRLAAPNLA